MVIRFVCHLLRETGWSTSVIYGTRQIQFSRGCARSISTTFSRKIGPKSSKAKGLGLVKNSKWNAHFHSEIPFGLFGLIFKKSRIPEKIFVRGEKINLSIYIPSETSGFLGANSNQLRIHHLEKSTNYIKLLRISTEVVFQLQFAVL